MRSFSAVTSLVLFSTVHFTNAYYACSTANAVAVSDLTSVPSVGGGSGGSSGGSSGGVIPSVGVSPGFTTPSSGCNSFWIAAGGDCTNAKAKTKRATYETLPCLDSMYCVVAGGSLGCWDMANNDYIADDGTCGNLSTGETREGCVEALLQEAGVGSSPSGTGGGSSGGSGSATATGTSSGSRSTTTSGSSSSGSSSSTVASTENGSERLYWPSAIQLTGLAAAILLL